jgi:1-acyl-sn-glycerol-3-phosphate acyltransferase
MVVKPGELGAFDPAFVRRWAPRLAPFVHRWFRAEVLGMEQLPRGPFLGVGNHSGGVLIPDTLVWLGAYFTSGRETPLLTLAHDQFFEAYPAKLTRFVARMGAIRADSRLALLALRSGHAVQVYPGGDHDACRSFFRRNEVVFAGRKGYVDLARQARVPIVPVVSVGGHEALVVLWDGAALAQRLPLAQRRRLKTLPLSVSVPWGLWLGPLPGYLPLPTKIRVRVLPPVSPDVGSVDEIDRAVRSSMQRAADAMARGRRLFFG